MIIAVYAFLFQKYFVALYRTLNETQETETTDKTQHIAKLADGLSDLVKSGKFTNGVMIISQSLFCILQRRTWTAFPYSDSKVFQNRTRKGERKVCAVSFFVYVRRL